MMKSLLFILLFAPMLVFCQTILQYYDFEDQSSLPLGSGTYNFGVTGEQMQGTYSALITAGTASGARIIYGANDTISSFCMVKITKISTNTAIIIGLYEGATLRVSLTHTTAARRMYIICGTANAFGGAADTLKLNTLYFLWFEYIKGTGANAIARAYWSTTPTKPGSPNINVTNGSITAQISRTYFEAQYSMINKFDEFTVAGGGFLGSYVPHEIYGDATGGNDATGDGTIHRPYKTLNKMSGLTWVEHDSVFLKRSGTFPDSLLFKSDSTYLGVYSTGNRPRLDFINPNGKNGISVSNCIYLNGWTWDYSTCPRDSVETARADSLQIKVNQSGSGLLRLK
jgi:hypothetical protein